MSGSANQAGKKQHIYVHMHKAKISFFQFPNYKPDPWACKENLAWRQSWLPHDHDADDDDYYYYKSVQSI